MVCFIGFIPIYSILDDKNEKIALEMSFTIFGNEFQYLEMSFAIFLEMSFGQIGQKNLPNAYIPIYCTSSVHKQYIVVLPIYSTKRNSHQAI